MDTAKLKEVKLKLRNDITERIRQFQDETGCVPEIDINFITVEQVGGRVDSFPSVTVKCYL